MAEYCSIMVTVPHDNMAGTIAKALVSEKLAACVQIIGPIRSIYTWQNKVCDDTEILLLIKTTMSKFDRIRDRVVSLHNYDVPEIIALPIEKGLERYLDWIDDVTS